MKTASSARLVGMLCMMTLLIAAAPPPAESPVADAAMREDREAVVTLVKQGADVNAAQADGMTALHWAAENGDPALAEVLVYAGASTRAVTRLGAYTPLHLASRAGHADVVKVLLKAGSSPNDRTTSGGATALHFAVSSGSVEAVAALLDSGAEIDSRASAWEQTPLMWAAAYGQPAVVQLLLQRGADAALTSRVEDLAEWEKVDREAEKLRNDRLAALRKLEEKPAANAAAAPAQAQNAEAAAGENEDDDGQGVSQARPAQAAAPGSETGEPGEKKEEEADAPLSYGQLVGHKGGLTPLLFATRQGNIESVMALLDAGADIDQVSAGDHTSPLLMATINGHFDLAMKLIERGADVNLTSHAAATPLYTTINMQWAPKALYPQPVAYQQQQTTYLELMEALLKAGADPNVRLSKHLWYMEFNFGLLGVDTKGATPFWRAAYATDVEAMKLLLAHGADASIPTEKGAERRRRSGTDDEKEDPSGLPPVPVGGPGVHAIHAASGVGYGEGYAANSHRHVPGGWLPAMKFLIEELGMDVNARDHNGYTALHHAASRGDNELILYLVEQGADVTVVSRKGQTTADMANGPFQRVPPFPETVRLLESLGAKNNNNCMSC